MTDQNNDSTNLADDIFGFAAYEAPRPMRKVFLPWHRPRKQFVRQRQWLEQISRMLDESSPAEQTLKYLGLPGVDLLDLRFFHENLCVQRGLKLRFLGFNTAANPANEAQTELNISLDEVRRLAGVDPQSNVIGDDVRAIANQSSIAWKRTFDLGPYDVVNLDLCDGFGVDDPGDTASPTYFDALNALVSLQARSKTPWLLLLTTRSGNQQVHADVFRRFVDKYSANLADCPPFKTASRELFQFDQIPAGGEVVAHFLPLFLCGLCKWMLNLATGLKPPSSVAIKSIVGYRIDQSAPHEDLVSVAAKFEPLFTPVADSMGLARMESGPGVDECDFAAKVIKRVAKLANADDILRNDAQLHKEMVEATASSVGRALRSGRLPSMGQRVLRLDMKRRRRSLMRCPARISHSHSSRICQPARLSAAIFRRSRFRFVAILALQ